MTLPVAAAAAWALRRPAAGSTSIGLAAAIKYGPSLLAPYLWLRHRHARRPLLLGAGALGVVVGLHVLIDPTTWSTYLSALGQQAMTANDAPFVGDQLLLLIPSTLGDFLLRLTLATVLTIVAIRQDWGWLAFAAAMVAVPTLWFARLAPLVAVPRLWWEERGRSRQPRP